MYITRGNVNWCSHYRKQYSVKLAAQSSSTLCNTMDYVSSVHNFSDKNTGVGSHILLQEISLTQGLNPDLLHCWQILYHLSQQGIPRKQYGDS